MRSPIFVLCRALCLFGALASLCVAPERVWAQGSVQPDQPRRWVVNGPGDGGALLHQAPAADAPIVSRLAPGDILSNLGCDVSWCEVRPFRGGPRGFVPAYLLAPARGPDGTIPLGPDDSRQRAKKKRFNAEGRFPCSQEQGEQLGTCNAGIARSDGGDASAAVTFGNGFTRLLFFTQGEFIGANATMSGVGNDIDWWAQNGTYHIRVDDQRYVIPAALLFGEER